MKQKLIIKKCKNEVKKLGSYQQKNISVGSDCEVSFGLNSPTPLNFYPANNFLNTSLKTQLGCDGCSSIAELRPNYAFNPLEHLNNLKKIMGRLAKKTHEIENLKVYAGNGFKYSTGGHIHFNIPLRRGNHFLINLLDLMSIFLLPLENKTNAVRRKINSGYGKLYAYELKSYGFEYRTFGSWLYSENTARSILSLAYVLAYEFMNNRELCLKMIRTFKNKFNSRVVSDYAYYHKKVNYNFNYHNTEFFILKNFDFYNYFMKNVRKMLLYPEYKPYIEYLFSLYHLKKRFKEGYDILKRWHYNKIRYYLFNFSSDDFLSDIKKQFKNTALEDRTEKSIYVFGLTLKHEYHIETNNKHLYELIKRFAEETDNSLKVVIKQRYNKNSIGLRWDLREEKQNLIIQMFKYIKENLNKKYLIENKSEEEIAETDTEEENDNYDDNRCSTCGEYYDFCVCEDEN